MPDVPPARHRIDICLGSSCFARGSQRYPGAVQEWLAEHRIDAEVSGHLCREECREGPKVLIDGVPYRVPDLAVLRALLARQLAPAGEVA